MNHNFHKLFSQQFYAAVKLTLCKYQNKYRQLVLQPDILYLLKFWHFILIYNNTDPHYYHRVLLIKFMWYFAAGYRLLGLAPGPQRTGTKRTWFLFMSRDLHRLLFFLHTRLVVDLCYLRHLNMYLFNFGIYRVTFLTSLTFLSLGGARGHFKVLSGSPIFIEYSNFVVNNK